MVQAGAAAQLRVEVGTRSYENDLNSYNVLAEIPGTDAMLRHDSPRRRSSGFVAYGDWCHR